MSYRRAASAEADDEDGLMRSSEIRPPRGFAERLTDKAIAAAWILAAWLVARRTHFFSVLFYADKDSKANRGLLQLVAICLGVNTVLFLYLTVYLPRFKGLTDSTSWSVYCPRIIPLSTALFALSTVLLIRATWPVWGFLAPLVLGVEAMGGIFALHFIPWPF